MVKKLANEKLNCPANTSDRPLGLQPLLKNHAQYLLPGVVIFCCAVLVYFFTPVDSSQKQNDQPDQNQNPGHKNFGFMRQTARWMNDESNLTAGETTFDLSEDIPTWTNYGSRLSTPIKLPKLEEQHLFTFILKQLGATNPWQAFTPNVMVLEFYLDETQIYNSLIARVAPTVNRQTQNAKLIIQNLRAIEFEPEVTGQAVDYKATVTMIKRALFTNRLSAPLPTITIQPSVRLTDINELGIKTLVARGESNFTGSSANRIHNIRTGASKFNGIILTPGEEFSFNRYLGAVTAELGFKPELVIKSTGTVPELGGGLCQVSTTAFRAALYGGLPITARKNHSYAVKYYSPQGTDATIYPGAVDFKFVNDTPAHLLIWTKIEGTKLLFDFYGTDDNRQIVIDGPYQYDRGAGGAMKARLTRTVKKDGKEIVASFLSRYVSKDLFPTVYEYPKPLQPTPPPLTSTSVQPSPGQSDNLPNLESPVN